MRRVNIPPKPESLDGPKAERERQRVATFYAIAENQTSKYTGKFLAYKADDVKLSLHKAFHGKCAYCESPVEATQPFDVEHFRPKGAVMIEGTLQPPGYYWLASCWENLLPSCTDCNRPRRQDFPERRKPATAGKANQFPLSSESARAKAEGEEIHECPMLLHPYFDHPAEHLEYIWKPDTPQRGEVVASTRSGTESPKGRTSIDTYALQRLGLIRQRRERLTRLLAHLKLLAQMRAWIEKSGGSPDLEAAFMDILNEVNQFLAPDMPYSAMCQQVVQAFQKQVFP